MGYLINKGGLVVYKTTFTGSEIQTMGSTPLDLNPIGNDINGLMFMPIFGSIILKNTTTPFNFSANDGPAIYSKNGDLIMFAAAPLQGLSDNTLNNVLLMGDIHNISGSKTAMGSYITSGLFQLTTLQNNDATQGDSEVNIILAGFNYKFL